MPVDKVAPVDWDQSSQRVAEVGVGDEVGYTVIKMTQKDLGRTMIVLGKGWVLYPSTYLP